MELFCYPRPLEVMGALGQNKTHSTATSISLRVFSAPSPAVSAAEAVAMRFAAQAAAAHAAAAAAAARGQPPTAATSSNVPPPPTNGQDRQAVERGGSEGFNGNGDTAASSDGNNPNQGLLNVGIPNILRAALTGSRDVRVLKIETVILKSLFSCFNCIWINFADTSAVPRPWPSGP